MAEQPRSFVDRLRGATSDLRRWSLRQFRNIASRLSGRGPASRDWMTRHRERLFDYMGPNMLGRLCMYIYDPKHKATLPYYDRFPLVVPIELYQDGWLGLNLHYLPPHYRAVLFDVLMRNIIQNSRYNENRRIRITYDLVRQVSRNRYYLPTIKRYLRGHVKTKIYWLRPQDWEMALYLPTERFVKRTRHGVWRESLRQIHQRPSYRRRRRR